jgi:hypothetical protein
VSDSDGGNAGAGGVGGFAGPGQERGASPETHNMHCLQARFFCIRELAGIRTGTYDHEGAFASYFTTQAGRLRMTG